MSHSVACDVCGADDSRPLFVGHDHWLGCDGDFPLVECTRCGAAYLNPQPDADELATYYPDGYYAYRPRKILNAGASLRKRISQRIKDNRDYGAIPSPGTGQRALDVGCGAGNFMQVLIEHGWDAYGVEPYQGAEAAIAGGLKVTQGQLQDAGYPDGHFHFIRLNHVLEHVPSPSGLMPELHRVLAADGVLQISVPNFGGLNARLFGPYWHNLDLPRHLYQFRPAVLRTLLQKNGFEVARTRYRKSHMGTSLNYQLRDQAPHWQRGTRARLVATGLRVTRPLLSLLARTSLGDEMTVQARKADAR